MKSTKLNLLAALMGLFVAGTLPLHAQAPTPYGGAGTRPVAVLFCQYSDKPNTYGFTPAGILANTWLPNSIKFTYTGATGDNSISGLIQEASLGTISLQGTQAFGWFTLPKPLSAYPGDPNDSGASAGAIVGNDCIATAQQNGVSLAAFTYVAVYMNDAIPIASGVSWPTTWTGATTSPTAFNALIVGVRGLTSPALVLHEFGHILSNGGMHTDSYSDPLGGAAWFGDDPTNPPSFGLRLGSVSPEWDASRRELMGFIPAASIATFSGGSQTYNISRLTQPIAGLPTVIDVPLPNGAKYVISARTQVGYDSYPIYSNWFQPALAMPVQGVRIELFTSTSVDAHIEMSNPGGDPQSNDAVWLTGQTYTDSANGITIKVGNFNAKGNPTATITVSSSAAASSLSGNHTLIPQNAPGMCLDANGYGNSNGTVVDIWNCVGQTNESFTFVPLGNGIYQIHPSYNSSLCLDVNGGGNSPSGTTVDLWACVAGANNEQFQLINDGGNVYELAPQNAPGLRVEVLNSGTANGTQVEVSTANSGSNQKWAIN